MVHEMHHMPHLTARSSPSFNNVTFNWTLSDMDGMLVYQGEWNNTYSRSNKPNGRDSIVGKGESAHSTIIPNSKVLVNFVGTGVYFMGDGVGSLLRLTVDGNNADYTPDDPSAPLLAFKDKLAYGTHEVVLSVLSNDTTISLSQVKVLTGILTEVTSFTSSAQTETLAVEQNALSSSFNFSDGWNTITSIGSDKESYTAATGDPRSSFTYSVPANTAFITINGTSEPSLDASTYSVTLKPEPPNGGSATGLSSYRSFLNPISLFFGVLDPNVQYTLTFAVAAGTGVNKPIGVHSITAYSALKDDTSGGGTTPNSPTDTGGSTDTDGGGGKKNNTPIIAGAVAGGVVSIAVILALVVGGCLLLKRRRNKMPQPRKGSSTTTPDMFVTDEDHDATPFMMPQRISLVSSTSTTPLTAMRSDPSLPLPAAATAAAAAATRTHGRTRSATMGFAVVNPDPATGLPTNVRDAAVASHNAGQQKRAAAHSQSRFDREYGLQERDAGPMMATVPPSYDPTWADGRTDIATVATGSVAGYAPSEAALTEAPTVTPARASSEAATVTPARRSVSDP